MADIKIDNSTLSFLTDWRERAKRQQRNSVWIFVSLFVVTFLICLWTGFWFQKKNYDRIVMQNRNYIQDSAVQEAIRIEEKMLKAEAIAVNFAKQYAFLEQNNKDMTVEDRLRTITDKTLFDRIAFIDTEGNDISLEGTTNVADRNYFQQAMQGNAGWESLEASRITGSPNVVFYAPIMVDEKIIGVMAGFYDLSRMKKLFTYDYFNYTPDNYLLHKDGKVIVSSNNRVIGENVLELLAQKDFNSETGWEDIKELLQDQERTTGTFTYREKNKTYVGVVAQFTKSDWMILSILPYDVTEGMVSNANRIGVTFLGIMTVIFFVAILLVLFIYRKMNGRYEKEMSLAISTLQKSVEDKEYQLSIIQTLTDIYSSVYYTGLEDGRYQQIKETESVTVTISPNGVWKAGVTKYCDECVAEDFREILKSFMMTEWRVKEEEDVISSMEYRRADGQWRRACMIPLKHDDGQTVAGYIFAVQKIDAEKKKELMTKKALEEAYAAAQMASKAKTLFLSNMSHDIRTPMNAIVGMTAIASAHLNEPDKIADCLKKITVSSKHLLGLINEVLDMSKIESGKVDLNEEEFSLPELVDALISLNMPLIKEKNHTLLVTVKNIIHENVVGDSTRLQQVLTNLLTNAIKYTPENGKIEVTVSEKETNKATVGLYEISVKDNGIGISEEYMSRIFEPFVRAADNRISGIQGTGLGMPIARNIIRMMNGDITVESKLNEGSTFTVSFSLKLQGDQEVDYGKFVDLPILVVDDDVIACESTCTLLNELQMNSEWVNSGREGIDRLKAHHEADNDFYAVILDWKMPDMDGVEVTRQIRREIGDDVPIIIMSAYDWTDIEQEAKEAGVNAFLSKPLFRSRIVDLFNDLLQEDKDLEAQENSEKKEEKFDFSGKRVLLVEDNEVNREIAVELLTMLGLEMETAEDGKIGVEKFSSTEKGYYDLILMDIQMPVMNGYEAARAIRSLPREDAISIPIIAMTANAFSSDVRDAYNAGMTGHIAKPIDINHVVSVLGEQLNAPKVQ